MSWLRKCFLVGEILFKSRILRSSFLIGLFLIRVKRGAQDIFLYTYACRPSHAEPVNFTVCQCLLITPIYIDNLRVRPLVFEMDRQSFRGVYGHVSKVVSFHRFVSFTSRISTYHLPWHDIWFFFFFFLLLISIIEHKSKLFFIFYFYFL